MTEHPRPGQPLTPRELEVLRLMADGHSNRRIGQRLALSEDTIKTHARRLFAKLGVDSRAHAVALGYQRGVIAMPWGSEPRLAPRPTEPTSRPIGQPAPGSIAAHVHAASHTPTRRTS